MTVEIKTYLALSQDPTSDTAFDTWQEISEYVGDIQITRGRQSERSTNEPGTMALALDDSTSQFDAENADSDLYPYADITACVKVEITALGTVYPVCVMYADDAPPAAASKEPIASWQFTDGHSLLATDNWYGDGLQHYPQQLTGASIHDCLDELGPGPVVAPYGWRGLRAISAGTVEVQAVAAGGLDGAGVAERIATICEVENGSFFWSRAGTPTFLDQLSRLTQFGPSQTTFSDEPIGDEIGYLVPSVVRQRSDIENVWEITPTGGTVQSDNDQASITKNGRNLQSKDLPFAYEGDALVYCQHRVAERKDPQTRVGSLACPLADEATWAACLALELGDIVTLKRAGHETPMIFEGMSLDTVKADGTFTAMLSPAESESYWLLEDDYFSGIEFTTRLW